MPKHLHLSELERLERIARLDADEERQEARDRAAEASDGADLSWLTENSGCHMSQQERLDHPENA